MDLNVSPEPEEDEVFPELQSEEVNFSIKHVEHNEDLAHGKSALLISFRECEDRTQRMRRQRPHDRPSYGYQHDPGKKHRTSNRLPPGWLDCPAFGQEISCLIPSKVPLGESFNDCIPPGKRYSYRQVVHQQRVLGRKLGLVIDLTNSRKYYNLNDWKKEGIKHVKIACKGRNTVPENEAVNNFVHEVSQFLVRHKDPKKYILVHCTHGHNRTGYMIVHYLMRSLHISVTQAINIFSDARPPGIYKPDYVEALYKFYHERKPDMVVCPPLPKWKESSDLDLNGDVIPDEDDDDDGDSAAPVDESHTPHLVLTNDDILGDEIPVDQEKKLQRFCYQLLKLPTRANAQLQFPGSHPVSLNSDNLQLLRQRYYYATWKADGTRYMMLITSDGCYLIDRRFSFRRVQMRFPCRRTLEKGITEKAYHHFTLLDGEMVIDASEKQERRYLIYDMMAFNQISLVEMPFWERWNMIEKEVIQPRKVENHPKYHDSNLYYEYDLEPFRVRRKSFWVLSTVPIILNRFIPSLSHDADGLIFQCWDDPYIPRTHMGLLKWKYPEMNSVDFLFEEMADGRQSLYLNEGRKKKLMEGNRVVFPVGRETSTYAGKIIECSWDSGEEVWRFMRVRPDKGTPNEFNTYMKVMRSIRDNIIEEELLSEIKEIIALPMYAVRIEKERKAYQHR